MILLVTAAERAADWAAHLARAISEPVVIARNFREAATYLRTVSYTLAVFDHHLMEAEPNEAERTFAHLGEATMLEINFAVTGMERLIGEAKSELKRRERNQAAARAAVVRALHGEFKETLTSLLLDCDMALAVADLPPAAGEKLTRIREVAQKFRLKLESAPLAS